MTWAPASFLLAAALATGLAAPALAAPRDLMPGKAQDQAPQPYQLVRTLERVQNEAAMGDTAAYAARPKLVASIAGGFAAADPSVWKDPRNVQAAAIYILSGGQSPVVQELVDRGVFPADQKKLMRGVLAFARGRAPEAKHLLLDIDARSLSESLGAQLALIQSLLVADHDRPRAIGLLDLARLLMPGTLVEDVALRREAFLVAEAGEVEKFLSLSEQYIRRFPRSVYAEDFMRRFVASTARLKIGGKDTLFARLAGIIGLLAVDEQRRIFLSLAEAAALDGRVVMTRFAAGHARAICPKGDVARMRADLYLAAAMILTDDYDEGLAILDRIDEARLPSADAHLRQAVLAVARQVRPSMDGPAPKSGSPLVENATPVDLPASKAASVEIGDAQRQMAEADRLLRNSVP